MVAPKKSIDAPFTLADAEARLVQDREELRHRVRRLQLVVGVINGAGFTAVGAKVLEALAASADGGAPVVALIFPSAVLFFWGMVAIGLSIGLDVISAHLLVNKGQALRNSIAAGKTGTLKVTPLTIKDALHFYGLEAVSALFFIGGVAYPLIVLMRRYVRDGGFTW